MRRWLVRSLVVLTALLCLGTVGYAGQVWWARKIARAVIEDPSNGWPSAHSVPPENCLQEWREIPWYGMTHPFTSSNGFCPAWIPSRTGREILVLLTGVDLGSDPDAWEAWFKDHPNLVWDEKLKRLVEPPAGGVPTPRRPRF